MFQTRFGDAVFLATIKFWVTFGGVKVTEDGLLGGDTDESELVQWFDNLVTFAEYILDKWQESKDACNASRVGCKAKDEHCDKIQLSSF